MAELSPAEGFARIVVLGLGMFLFNAFARGEAADWARAKFFNAEEPSSGRSIFGRFNAAGGVVGGGAPPITLPGGTGGTVGSSSGTPDLVAVGSTRMSRAFAARWSPLVAAAKADGIIITGDAYRSSDQQRKLRIAHCKHPDTDPASACTPPTAPVGKSRHETGDAIDVHLTGGGGRGSPEYRWLAKNAARFQVFNLASEPWHWSIDGS